MLKPIAYDIPEPCDIEILKDVPYQPETNPNMTMDIYKPYLINKGSSCPAVVFIHGGTNEKKDYKSFECFTSWAKLVSANGMIGITFNWRKNTPCDIEACLKFLMSNSKNLQIDTDQISTFSFSRGVHSGVLYSLKFPRILKMVIYYGKIPKGSLTKSNTKRKFFIAMAQNDRFYDSHCNDDFIQKANTLNDTVEFFIHSKGEHGFDFRNRDEESKEIIKCTLDFLKQRY